MRESVLSNHAVGVGVRVPAHNPGISSNNSIMKECFSIPIYFA